MRFSRAMLFLLLVFAITACHPSGVTEPSQREPHQLADAPEENSVPSSPPVSPSFGGGYIGSGT